MAILGPFEPIYPVDFRSGGDTTTAAFGKHIQEIERIYGIINSLDADKISASEITDKLNKHINSSAPHPNLALSSLLGNLDIARITGNLAASRVSGTLNNANISADNVNNLKTFVEKLIPGSSSQQGTFVCNAYGTYTQGYATFNAFNTVWQICFGRHPIDDYGNVDQNERTIRTISYLNPFSVHTSIVVLTLSDNDTAVGQHKNWVPMLNVQYNTGFTYHIEHPAAQTDTSASNMEISYIAIGH